MLVFVYISQKGLFRTVVLYGTCVKKKAENGINLRYERFLPSLACQ